MIVTEFLMTRTDGVKLFYTVDAVVDKNGTPVRDDKGNLIPTGFQIKQVETGVTYSQAIDVEDAPFTYIETDQPIEVVTR